MTKPRSQLIALDATPYYHCISRCVRRAFLCGEDKYTGRNFDHRKQWLVERISLLSRVFAIDIAAYAIMSNHIHLVLHINRPLVLSWDNDEIMQRWTRLYKGPTLMQRYLLGETLSAAEEKQLQSIISACRDKLHSISRFMSCLNEFIARKANIEDNCTGRFWEGRFKSQALLDEAAIISCMTYVDLNPVRAGIASSLQESTFTSVHSRIDQLKSSGKTRSRKQQSKQASMPKLMPFSETLKQDQRISAIPFNLKDYLILTDWTGRIVRSDKRGHITDNTPNILSSLGISPLQWQILALEVQKQSISMLNGMQTLEKLKKKAQKQQAA